MISLGLLFLNCEFSAIRSALAWKVSAAGSACVCLVMSKLIDKSFNGLKRPWVITMGGVYGGTLRIKKNIKLFAYIFFSFFCGYPIPFGNGIYARKLV